MTRSRGELTQTDLNSSHPSHGDFSSKENEGKKND